MRPFILAALAALLITRATPAPTQWRLTWSDEFNAPTGTPPDPTKWIVVTGGNGFGNKESETYTARPENLQQSGGNLVITARREDYTGPDGLPAHYTSARLDTQGHFAQTYGRFEARMKLPAGKGICPPSGCSATTTAPPAGRSAARSTSSKPSAPPPPPTAPFTAPVTAAATPSPPTLSSPRPRL